MSESNKSGKIIFYLINLLVIFSVFGLTLYKIINENGIETFSYISNISFIALLFLTLIFFVNYYIEGIILAVSMKEYKRNFNAGQGFMVHSVGALFSAITPLKVGYLPSIAYSYSRFDVKGEDVIKSIAKTSYTYQVYCLLISLFALVVCINKEMIVNLGEVTLDLKNVALIGVGYNSILMIGYFILALSPQIHNLIIRVWAWILFKFKKDINKEEYIKNKEERMKLIREGIREYFKDIKQFVKLFSLYVIKASFYSALPYIVFLLLSGQSFQIETWVYAIILRELITYIINIIPIPGGSGAAEVIFIATFSLIFFPNDLLNSTMLIWRLFSYFINILVGFIVFLVMIHVKKKSKDDLTQ